MKVLIIADGRSPTTKSWIRQIASIGYEVALLSTYSCDLPEGVSEMYLLPLAFSRAATSRGGESSTLFKKITKKLIQNVRLSLLNLRYYLGPLSVMRAADSYRKILDQVKPDLVHGLRIPYEGMLAAYTPLEFPVIISTWGNDFTLHAQGSPLMRHMTRKAVTRADGFVADCMRDIRLAGEWGLSENNPTRFAPGNGGLHLAEMEIDPPSIHTDRVRNRDPWRVINPRGIRPAYVMNDAFFKAIPLIHAKEPRTNFWATAMRGQVDAEKWVKRLSLDDRVCLLTAEPQQMLWDRFRQSSVLISPATHDGTPNSVLEGMALGCLPVVGRIESLEEWIEHGKNGLLIDPEDPKSIAEGILEGLRNIELQERAARFNLEIIRERADSKKVRSAISVFYQVVLGNNNKLTDRKE